MNFFKKLAAKMKGDRREFTVEVASDIFAAAGDEVEQHEVVLTVPETHIRIRLEDRNRGK